MSSDETVVAVCQILSSSSTGTSVLERDLVGLFGPARHQLVERIIKHKDSLVASFKVIAIFLRCFQKMLTNLSLISICL